MVAHSPGGRGVVGSNPIAPTISSRSEEMVVAPKLLLLGQVHIFHLADSGEGERVFRGDFLEALKAA
jgi:hypothetical protein